MSITSDRPNRPSHQLEPGTRQHCVSTPAHMSSHCLTAYALVCCRVSCLPHTSPLLPRRASAILAEIYRVAYRHHLRPHCRSISHTRPMSSSTHPSGMRHVLPRHRIRTPSALTLLRRCHRSSPSSVPTDIPVDPPDCRLTPAELVRLQPCSTLRRVISTPSVLLDVL